MSPLLIIIGILVFGTILFIVEVFFLPTLVVGKIAFVVTILGLAVAFYELGAVVGSICVLATIVVNGLLLYFGMDRISNSKIAVREVIDSKVNLFDDHGLKINDEGIAVTDLRPEGKAEFNDKKVTVWAYDGFIEALTPVSIHQIQDNKIFVKTI
jgi:membrane-bound ClpP family serine protease